MPCGAGWALRYRRLRRGSTHTARHFDAVQAGDFAAVTRAGDVFRLNPTALDFEEAEQRLADVQSRMPSVVEARAVNEVGREQDAELWAQRRAENMLAYALHSENRDAEQDIRRTDAETAGAVYSAADTIEQTVDRGSGIARRALASSRPISGRKHLCLPGARRRN